MPFSPNSRSTRSQPGLWVGDLRESRYPLGGDAAWAPRARTRGRVRSPMEGRAARVQAVRNAEALGRLVARVKVLPLAEGEGPERGKALRVVPRSKLSHTCPFRHGNGSGRAGRS